MFTGFMLKTKPGVRITAEEFGDRWPFTVASVELVVDRDAVYVKVGRTHYALNGLATARGDLDAVDIDPIWKANPVGVPPKMDLGPVVARAFE